MNYYLITLIFSKLWCTYLSVWRLCETKLAFEYLKSLNFYNYILTNLYESITNIYIYIYEICPGYIVFGLYGWYYVYDKACKGTFSINNAEIVHTLMNEFIFTKIYKMNILKKHFILTVTKSKLYRYNVWEWKCIQIFKFIFVFFVIILLFWNQFAFLNWVYLIMECNMRNCIFCWISLL